MRRLLCSMRDTFRLRHGEARGQYTYWSQRSRARPRNRGLRIDYFLVPQAMPAEAVVDVQILQDLPGSDHCPLLLELNLGAMQPR